MLKVPARREGVRTTEGLLRGCFECVNPELLKFWRKGEELMVSPHLIGWSEVFRKPLRKEKTSNWEGGIVISNNLPRIHWE